jgi:hypothetical protein
MRRSRVYASRQTRRGPLISVFHGVGEVPRRLDCKLLTGGEKESCYGGNNWGRWNERGGSGRKTAVSSRHQAEAVLLDWPGRHNPKPNKILGNDVNILALFRQEFMSAGYDFMLRMASL